MPLWVLEVFYFGKSGSLKEQYQAVLITPIKRKDTHRLGEIN